MQNYWQVHAIQEEIRRVPHAGHESVLYGVWNTILTWQFPVIDGYVTRPQDTHTSQSGEAGYSDLHTYQYVADNRTATKFLLTQCKKAGLETQDSTWQEGHDQLSRYSASTHGRRRADRRSPVYGIVAVGNYMRAYKYDDDQKLVVEWAPWGMNASEILRIDKVDDKPHVQRILDHIRDHH
ncbi:hypothetical protein N7510_007502 [Penicillium lagena]|uniref:uncharacterized protein n=1 Tax=Penicillium lagena TaxID=94218 RepID=UPI002541CEC4|nr:uncharacterized protein N7510_007502 [Penicillium lagena]KAJ5610783.1 hypothetical protein N7510_007502 [Penicillium lagena]